MHAHSTSAPALPYDSFDFAGPRQRPQSASRRRPESARGLTTGLALGLGAAGLPYGNAGSGLGRVGEAPRPRALLVNGLAPATGGDAANGAAPRTGYKQLLRRHEVIAMLATDRRERLLMCHW